MWYSVTVVVGGCRFFAMVYDYKEKKCLDIIVV